MQSPKTAQQDAWLDGTAMDAVDQSAANEQTRGSVCSGAWTTTRLNFAGESGSEEK
jgi:hypothetical protein